MDTKQSDSEYPPREADRRRDAVLKHMQSRPYEPHKAKTRQASKGRVRKGKSRA